MGFLDSLFNPSIEKLIEKGDIKGLINALSNKDYSTRASATNALVGIGEPAVDLLIQALGDGNDRIRDGAAETLSEMGASVVGPVINAFKNSKNNWVRQLAVRILGKTGDNRVIESLVSATSDPSENIREEAVRALGKFNDLVVFASLIYALNDKSAEVRKSAVDALGKIGDTGAVDSLIQILLHDDDGYVRQRAASTLGEIGDNRALEPLLTAFKNDSYCKIVAAMAIDTLKKSSTSRNSSYQGSNLEMAIFLTSVDVTETSIRPSFDLTEATCAWGLCVYTDWEGPRCYYAENNKECILICAAPGDILRNVIINLVKKRYIGNCMRLVDLEEYHNIFTRFDGAPHDPKIALTEIGCKVP